MADTMFMDEEESAPMFESICDGLDSLETEVEYLRWFKRNADFGPADSDVHYIMDEQYTEETGRPVPEGWSQEE